MWFTKRLLFCHSVKDYQTLPLMLLRLAFFIKTFYKMIKWHLINNKTVHLFSIMLFIWPKLNVQSRFIVRAIVKKCCSLIILVKQTVHSIMISNMCLFLCKYSSVWLKKLTLKVHINLCLLIYCLLLLPLKGIVQHFGK